MRVVFIGRSFAQIMHDEWPMSNAGRGARVRADTRIDSQPNGKVFAQLQLCLPAPAGNHGSDRE
jgi:hypothetical protein